MSGKKSPTLKMKKMENESSMNSWVMEFDFLLVLKAAAGNVDLNYLCRKKERER